MKGEYWHSLYKSFKAVMKNIYKLIVIILFLTAKDKKLNTDCKTTYAPLAKNLTLQMNSSQTS